MASHRVRATFALVAALIVAALLSHFLLGLGALRGAGEVAIGDFRSALIAAIVYGLPLAALAVVATEALRLRQIGLHLGIGTLLTFLAAQMSTRGEPMTSPIFSGGALLGLGLLAVGIGASTAYWAIAGRRAGWRGDQVEQAEKRVADAFARASAQAKIERCYACVVVWVVFAAASASLLVWSLTEISGFRVKLLADAERQGQAVLRQAGHGWAAFTIAEDRGVISGIAPDELEKRAAYDSMREALSSVTGFPGIISGIDDKATARIPIASVSQQLAEVARREEEARLAVEEARRSAEAARAAADEIKRRAAEQAATPKTPAAPEANGAGVAALLPPAQPAQPATPEPEQPAADPAAETNKDTEVPPCSSEHLAVVKSSAILFERQRFDIAPTYDGELERLAATAQACAPWPVVIIGHADTQGDNVFNERISSLRAIAVRENLIERGVSPDLVVAKPAVDTFQADSANEETAFNRRTEFKLVEPSKITRDATQDPSARARNCENDLAGIMSKSIIHFSIGSARVTEQGIGVITELAAAIRKCGSVIVTVEGHTDSLGPLDKNQVLSDRRAGSVRDLLITAGADPTRVMSRGFASSQPYDDAETAEAYALNRRIEFKVTSKFTTTGAGGP